MVVAVSAGRRSCVRVDVRVIAGLHGRNLRPLIPSACVAITTLATKKPASGKRATNQEAAKRTALHQQETMAATCELPNHASQYPNEQAGGDEAPTELRLRRESATLHSGTVHVASMRPFVGGHPDSRGSGGKRIEHHTVFRASETPRPEYLARLEVFHG